METSWPCVKCSGPVMLCYESFFPTFNWRLELFEGLPLRNVFLGYEYQHIICKADLIPHTGYSVQNLHEICSFDDHLSVLVLLR